MRIRTWVALLLLCMLTAAVVGVPVFLIRPFSPQTASDVSWAYALRRAAPLTSAVGALLLIAALVVGWRRTRWIGRVVLIAMATVTVGVAWFARQNHFEWMFRPAPDARFVAAAGVTDVEPDELVIGAAIGREALAFPVRRIGYHHLVNTTVGDEPIVATY
jgi:hypothetical protein